MKPLSILLSTINDRIHQASAILDHGDHDTEYIVVHQITNGQDKNSYQPFYDRYLQRPVRFIQQFEKGTGRSRNAALAAATGELLYLCDDDLLLEPQFSEIITKAAAAFPDTDIYTFKIRTTEGKPFKNYPASMYVHSLRTTATVSIVEMVIRKSACDKGWIRFDERFGLATQYNTGEEFVMLSDALKKGATARFIPEYIVQHPPVSSGKIFNREVAFDKGAMTARVYGWKCWAVDFLFAVRKYKVYRSSIGFFSFTFQMFKGSLHFFQHE